MGQQQAQRLLDLDVLRGLAVAGMIIVTSPGDWGKVYAPLYHAAWNGWTLADLVFPTFLFSVGMAVGVSFPRAFGTHEARSQFWLRVGRRVLALIVLGLALNSTYVLMVNLGAPPAGPDDHPALRFTGILQRIALCYLLAVALVVATGRKDEGGRTGVNRVAVAAAGVAILAGYWALLRFVPVPGFGAWRLDPAGNLPGFVDRAIFTPAHMWPLGSATWRGPVTYDPEGLLSTFPALFNVLCGVLAGCERRRPDGPRLGALAAVSAGLVILGLLLDPVFPINKRLWTSSFALLSSGISGLVLVATAVCLRSRVIARLAVPLEALGGNAILAFTLSILLGAFADLPLKGGANGTTWPHQIGDIIALGLIPDEHLASLACAFGILAIITLAVWPLHRRGVHLRL
jgi:predicted acyltransferase